MVLDSNGKISQTVGHDDEADYAYHKDAQERSRQPVHGRTIEQFRQSTAVILTDRSQSGAGSPHPSPPHPQYQRSTAGPAA